MIQNPDAHNVRVFKLQSPSKWRTAPDRTFVSAGNIASQKWKLTAVPRKLREASRNKAAREIHLQQELNTIQQATASWKDD
jgi:hypothetical protein